MLKLYSIARTTFAQITRQPIYAVIVLTTFTVLVIALAMPGWSMDTDYRSTDQRNLEQMGLYTLLIAGLIVAVFSASNVVSRELEDKTALTVVSKPVSRATFILGKFAGVLIACAVAFYLCTLVFLMTVRHKVMPSAADPYDFPVIVLGCSAFGAAVLIAIAGNYFFRWSVVPAGVWASVVLLSVAMGTIGFIGKGWTIIPFGQDINPNLLVGILLMLMQLVIFAALAVTVSTRFGQVVTLLTCIAVFAVGLIYHFLFVIGGRQLVTARILGIIAPNIGVLDPLDALVAEKTIPGVYILTAGLYCAVYTAALLAVGVAMLAGRQIASEGTKGYMPGAASLLAWVGRASAVILAVVAIEGPLGWVCRRYLNALGYLHDAFPGFMNAALGPYRGEFTPALGAWSGLLLAPAAALWLLWGSFARGARWAYWLVLSCAAMVVVYSIVAAFTPYMPEALRLRAISSNKAFVAVELILAAIGLIILVLPKTRRHFAAAR